MMYINVKTESVDIHRIHVYISHYNNDEVEVKIIFEIIEIGIWEEERRKTQIICKRNQMVIANTWFKTHPRRLYTFQIDSIVVEQRLRNSVRKVTTVLS